MTITSTGLTIIDTAAQRMAILICPPIMVAFVAGCYAPVMTLRRLVVVLVTFLVGAPLIGATRDTLPASLTDREFWTLTEQFSEPNGYFVSRSGSPDNLLSNEGTLSIVAAALTERVKPAGIYLGVGPEQNFTYIAATRPRLAFITDIRRGNLNLHLVYKAIFEMSGTRAEFVERLFSRKRPSGLATTPSATQLMAAYLSATPVEEADFQQNLKAIIDHLTRKHGFPMAADDLAGIEYVYRNFYRFGPAIYYTASINGRPGSAYTYAAIMSSVDSLTGTERGYLASDEKFLLIKTMETRNLIVPIVGDFAGPKALRALGAYLKEHGATVSAFYVSNVEDYLTANGVWPKFCANAAALPLDAGSIFIRASGRPMFASIAEQTSSCRAGQ